MKIESVMLVIIVTVALIGLVVSYVGYSTSTETVSVTQTKSLSTSSTVTSTFISTAPSVVSTSERTMVGYVTFVSVPARDYSRCGVFTAESVTLNQGTAQVTFTSDMKVDFAILDPNQYQTFANTMASATGAELSYCSALFTGSSLYSLGRSTNYTGQVQVPVTGTYYFVFLNHYFQSASIRLSVSGVTSVQTTITRLSSFYSTWTRTYPTEAVNVTAQQAGPGALFFIGVALIAFAIIAALVILLKPRMKSQAAKVKLQDKVNKLEAKLAESVPRSEAERLAAEIKELEKKLSASNAMADSLRADVAQLQDRLAGSIPKAELEAKVNELEAKASGARRDLKMARSTIEDLERQLSQSSAKIDELKSSDSVRRAELDAVKSELQANVSYLAHLEGELSRSVPKTEADSLRADVAQLQDRLAWSIPKAELEAKVNELEAKASGARRDLKMARSTIGDLERQLSQSSAKTDELQGKLSNSIPRAELETVKGELQSKIADLEGKLAISVLRSEADALAEKANRLEATLTETREKLNSAETRMSNLESRLAESVPKADAETETRKLTDKIQQLESKLSESVPRTDLDTAKAKADSTIRELEQKLSSSINEAENLKRENPELKSRLTEIEKELESARRRVNESTSWRQVQLKHQRKHQRQDED